MQCLHAGTHHCTADAQQPQAAPLWMVPKSRKWSWDPHHTPWKHPSCKLGLHLQNPIPICPLNAVNLILTLKSTDVSLRICPGTSKLTSNLLFNRFLGKKPKHLPLGLDTDTYSLNFTTPWKKILFNAQLQNRSFPLFQNLKNLMNAFLTHLTM